MKLIKDTIGLALAVIVLYVALVLGSAGVLADGIADASRFLVSFGF